MSRVARTVGSSLLVLVGVIAAVMVGVEPISAADEPDTRTFSVEGVVSVVDIDPALPGGQGFVLQNPTGPSWVDGARDENGDLTIRVKPDTEYRVYDPNTGTWPRATYEEAIVAGKTIRVGGRQYAFSDHYELIANYVWRPVKPAGSRPANPSAEPSDFLFQRTFNVLGSVTQRGVRLVTNDGIFCNTCGFVIGNITEFNNDHVAAVAAAHHAKLPVVVSDTTKYYVVEADGTKRKGSFADVVVGAELRVAGKYGFADADWRFLASYVWVPDRTNPGGVVQWQSVQSQVAQSESGGTYSTHHEGENVAGDSEVFPGRTVLGLWWTPQADGTWAVTGTWTASDAGGHGTISGSLSATWNPVTGALTGTADITTGTGRHVNLTGSGPVRASTLPGSTPPGQIPDLRFDLRVART